MKKHFLVICCCLCSHLQAQVLGEGPGSEKESYPVELSLSESLRYALSNNLSLKNQALARQITYKRIAREIIAVGLPNIEGNLSYDYNLAITNAFLPNFISPIVYDVLDEEGLAPFPQGRNFGVTPAQFGTTHGARAGLELNQLLFDFSYLLGLRSIKLFREQADKNFMQSEVELVQYIYQSYYVVLISEKYAELLDQNQKRLAQLLQETRLRYESGFVEQLDVQRVQVNLNLIEVEKERSLNQSALSRRVLNFQLGLPIDHPVKLSDSLKTEDFSELLLQVSTQEPAERLESQRLDLQSKLSVLNLKRQKANRYPSLSFKATGGYNSGREKFSEFISDEWFPYSTLNLNLKVPILSGLRTMNRIQELKMQVIQLEHEKIRLQRSLTQEQIQARSDLNSQIASLNAQKENLSLARKVYETSQEKYKQGIGSNLEVLTAATTLKKVETEYYTSLYEALLAKVAFQKAHGILYQNP